MADYASLIRPTRCKGDYKAALRMVLIAISFYEDEIAKLKREASAGFARGKVRKPSGKMN